MKRITSLLLVFTIITLCLPFFGCSNDNDRDQNESIELTTDNFTDYFTINLSVENNRLKEPNKSLSCSLCDVKLAIDSKTGKHPENVTVKIRIETEDGMWTDPDKFPVVATKTIEIPYKGSAEISIPMETWTAIYGLITIESYELSCVIVDVEGSIK